VIARLLIVDKESRMKNIAKKPPRKIKMRSEYEFDYSKAQANRFATRRRTRPVVVLLDWDVARVFKDPASVNATLRAILAALPRTRRPVKK
jgi:hypothetical protein